MQLHEFGNGNDGRRGSAEDGDPAVLHASGAVTRVAVAMAMAWRGSMLFSAFCRGGLVLCAVVVTVAMPMPATVRDAMGGAVVVVVPKEVVKADVDAWTELKAEKPHEQDDERSRALSS